MQVREKVGKSQNTAFFQWFVAREGRKTRLAKAAGAEPCGQIRDEKLHAIAARTTFPSQNAQNTPTSDRFRKLWCRKSAHRSGAKHIWKSKVWKNRERATCGHLRPLALAATCGHLRPLALAATCGHSIGCKWLQVVADEKRMRAATGGHSIGCKWLQVAAAEKRMLADTGGHWRPLDWLQVAASGCRWEENAGGHWRPRAATCGHSSGCKWLPLRRECWRTLAATGSHSIGCKWLQVAADENKMLVATGGHSIGRKWVQVAADEKRSGCKWLPGVGETIFFTIHPLLGGEYWEFSVACARKIYNILHGRSLGNVKYCTVLISMLREFLLIRHSQYETF